MRTEDMKAGVALSFATCFMLFLYAPLETYCTNVNEFWFDIYILFPPFLMIFFLFFIICVLLLCLVRKKWTNAYYILLCSYFVIFICTYVQGNVLAKSLPILNGAWIEWSDYPMERIKCVILWILVVCVVVLINKYVEKEKITKGIYLISICMSLMLIMTIITLLLTGDGLRRKENVSSTTENLFTMSEDNNYIVLCLDGLSSYDFNQLRVEHPEWNETFEDFTYFVDTFGVYPSTRYTVPFLFSGQWYDGKENYSDYNVRTYTQSSVLNEFEVQNYTIGLYITNAMMPQNKQMTKFDNIVEDLRGVNDWWAFIRWNLQITGFKYAPFDLKRICFVDPGAFEGLKALPEGYQSYTGNNFSFYQEMQCNDIVKTSNKMFKYIHIDGAHPPFRYNENVEEVDDATYSSSIEASITITNAFLQKLRENDVYDDSVIIVLADHGWDTGENKDNVLRWQNPILLIKGRNEKHDFCVSEAPISYVDMPEAFVNLLNGSSASEAFAWETGDERERRLLFDNGENERSGMLVEEHIQTGEAWNADTLIIGKRDYAD